MPRERFGVRAHRNGVGYHVGSPRRDGAVRIPVRVQAFRRRRSRLTLGDWTAALVMGLSIGAGLAWLLAVAAFDALSVLP